MDIRQREFWMTFRKALLLIVDGLERWLEIQPRTSELRQLLHRETINDMIYPPEIRAPDSANLA